MQVFGYDFMGIESFTGIFVLFHLIFSIGRWSWIVFVLSLGAKYLNFNTKFLGYANEAALVKANPELASSMVTLITKPDKPTSTIGKLASDLAKGRITQEQYDIGVEALKKATGAGEGDAVVFVADVKENTEDGLKAVVERAREAIDGVPAETRAANPDATTRYLRPRPGAARMYPETDIPPLLIIKSFIEKIRSNLPERAERKFRRLKKEYHLNDKLAKQIIDSEFGDLFEVIVKESNVAATTIAVFLTETLTSLRRNGISVENVSADQILDLFRSLGSGEIAKEALADVFVWLSENEDKNLHDAVGALELKMFSEAELTKLISRVIAGNRQLVNKAGKKALNILMGLVMKEVRGKADPRVVNELLREQLN